MLQEKLTTLQKTLNVDLTAMKQVYDVIESIKPFRKELKEACEKLKTYLDEGTAVAIDEEIKTALISVYGILERADESLGDESVAALFNS